ncbi:acid protease [Clavulina sp. PMI_390]|nr:acid protease [Clavulina sp. PMI_390]
MLAESASSLSTTFQRRRRLGPSDASLQHGESNIARRGSISGAKTLAAAGSGNITIEDYHDLLYIANITIGGTPYTVQLDSGSSDLVIFGNVANAKSSSLTMNLTYGQGFAAGTIATADVSFAGLEVSTQALLPSDQYSNAVTSYANGIFGLGFTSLSNIDSTVSKTNATWGASFLYNAFAQNPSTPNYMTFSLIRNPNNTDADAGGFTIGETDPEYSGVTTTDALSTWPVSNPTRWNILIDKYETLSGNATFKSAVPNVSSGQGVMLLDSGTAYAYAPSDMVNAMYQNVPGATFSSSAGQWTVPCNQQVFLGIWIGTRRFDIHPLDLVVQDINNPSVCVGSFISQALSVGAGEFDIIAGDTVMRNLYTLFDFGDFTDSSDLTMGDPYVQLLSVTNITTATVEFQQLRGGTTLNVTNPTNAGSGGTASQTTGTTLADLQKKINNLENMQPILLAIMAVNLVISLSAVGLGIWYFCCRRKKGSRGGDGGGGRKGGRRGRAGATEGNTISTMELTTKDGLGGSYAAVSTANLDEPLTPPAVSSAYDGPIGARQSTVSFRMDPFRQSRTLSGVSAFNPMVPTPSGAITTINEPQTPGSERGFDFNSPPNSANLSPERARVLSLPTQPAAADAAPRRQSAMPPPGAMMAPGMMSNYRNSSYSPPQQDIPAGQPNPETSPQAGGPPSPQSPSSPSAHRQMSDPQQSFARAPPPQRHSAMPAPRVPFPSSPLGPQSVPQQQRYSAMPAGAREAPDVSGFAPLTRQISPLAGPAATLSYADDHEDEPTSSGPLQTSFDNHVDDGDIVHAFSPDELVPTSIPPPIPVPHINVSSEDLMTHSPSSAPPGTTEFLGRPTPQFAGGGGPGPNFRHSARPPPRASAFNPDAEAYRRSSAM